MKKYAVEITLSSCQLDILKVLLGLANFSSGFGYRREEVQLSESERRLLQELTIGLRNAIEDIAPVSGAVMRFPFRDGELQLLMKLARAVAIVFDGDWDSAQIVSGRRTDLASEFKLLPQILASSRPPSADCFRDDVVREPAYATEVISGPKQMNDGTIARQVIRRLVRGGEVPTLEAWDGIRWSENIDGFEDKLWSYLREAVDMATEELHKKGIPSDDCTECRLIKRWPEENRFQFRIDDLL